jgi:hypothetical protein
MSAEARAGVHAGARVPEGPGDLRRLLADVVEHTRSLVRLELELARQEVKQALASLKRGLVLAAAGALLGALALGVLVTALVAGLATVWPVWLAAAVVAVVLGAVGGGLVVSAGRLLRGESLKPRATLQTIRETKQWLKART